MNFFKTAISTLFLFTGLILQAQMRNPKKNPLTTKKVSKSTHRKPPRFVEPEPYPLDTIIVKKNNRLVYNSKGYSVGLITYNDKDQIGIAYDKSKKVVAKLKLNKTTKQQQNAWQKTYGDLPQTTMSESVNEPLTKEMGVEESKKTWQKVAVQPEFNGNWGTFLQEKLRYPDTCQSDGTQGTVTIDFIVEKNGTITELKVAPESPIKNKFLVAECIRVLKLTSGKWKSGTEGNQPVRTYHQQSITFVLPEEEEEP
jgi:TonB family protein